MMKTYLKPFCDFCEKSNDNVNFMIAGPENRVHICDECAILCVEVIEKQKQKKNETD